MAAGNGKAPLLTGVHRVLIGVVVTGAVIIAGIGFAGSYAAVRELAVKKGFGNFSYVFPIGIDAGICVLLALDLLLTWIRIPFPLLRQSAWLLTAATIAFNGAAAWPDPLGVGMHAVIPVLFVVAVEAARHAIGRIADITADQHMEGVRLTRWLLSPLPTFLLWRRMKLWELRSYDQVIKLEQERLVYRASLRSRFGRAWRRKAPVESLMPLRLARYGVPLAETALAGLAAAGIEEPPIQFTVKRAPVPGQRQSPALEAVVEQETEPAQLRGAEPQPMKQAASAGPGRLPEHGVGDEGNGRHLADAYQAWLAAFGAEPTSAQFALWLQDRYGIATAAGGPLSDHQLEPLVQVLKQRNAPSAGSEDERGPEDAQRADDGLTWGDYFYNAWHSYAQEHGSYPDAAALAEHVYQRDGITGATGQPVTAAEVQAYVAEFHSREYGIGGPAFAPPAEDEAKADPSEQSEGEPLPGPESERQTAAAGAQAANKERGRRIDAKVDEQSPPQDPAEGGGLTVVDRYYLQWMEYQAQYGGEPAPDELSAFLAEKGMLGRGGKPVSPSTLRRYPLAFRTYNVWAEHRVRTEAPSADAVAQDCAARGITAQYNKPITPAQITEQTADFERRWHALTRYHAEAQQ
ncbi:DUF2637 domain-containing protein [Streptomyces sp. TP-A0356]|uniref:DUF2637 domain-containing protein n=1 Tax=Streptomyces sp. TP-A0356 TaxID=1359208 RepID=UPI000AEF5105|nr:DUF2637 domain-containing protein [Streptomyces sp. TP-A0356]